MATDTDTKWKLIYHGGFPGRGEYVRLIFEEAGVPYEDVGNAEGGSEVVLKYMQGKVVDGMPVQYPPIIEKGSFRLCQTPAIMVYLGKKFGLYPDNPEDEARCLQINLVLADYVAEVHDAYHPVEKSATYASQADVAKDHIARLIEKRIPRYLKHLEACLVYNNGGNGFFFDKLTYVDIAAFHALRSTESQFPSEYAGMDYIPKLKGLQERIAARPRIAAFLASERSLPFSGVAMM